MKTIKQVEVHAEYKDEFLPLKRYMEEGIIYISKLHKCCNHLCLCGCGHECFLPLGKGEWTLTDNNGKITITPSILQRFECKSHYIITNGKANFI